MDWLLDIRLIRFFSFYLAVMFLFSTVLRWRQYTAVLGLVRGMPSRWPRLLQVISRFRHIFLTWGTFLPLIATLVVLSAHTIAYRWLWPDADFRVRDLLELWPAIPVVALTEAAMLAFDLYTCWNVGVIDRAEVEKYFDQAEYWLKPWTAPVVHVFTLGYVNPRRMVDEEVRKALLSVSEVINTALWWVVVQTGLRIAYGLSLWLTHALEAWLRGLVGA
jgi:hypothetical protein